MTGTIGEAARRALGAPLVGAEIPRRLYFAAAVLRDNARDPWLAGYHGQVRPGPAPQAGDAIPGPLAAGGASLRWVVHGGGGLCEELWLAELGSKRRALVTDRGDLRGAGQGHLVRRVRWDDRLAARAAVRIAHRAAERWAVLGAGRGTTTVDPVLHAARTARAYIDGVSTDLEAATQALETDPRAEPTVSAAVRAACEAVRAAGSVDPDHGEVTPREMLWEVTQSLVAAGLGWTSDDLWAEEIPDLMADIDLTPAEQQDLAWTAAELAAETQTSGDALTVTSRDRGDSDVEYVLHRRDCPTLKGRWGRRLDESRVDVNIEAPCRRCNPDLQAAWEAYNWLYAENPEWRAHRDHYIEEIQRLARAERQREAMASSLRALGNSSAYFGDLVGADLREADLRDADLRDADLRDAWLNDADLYRADLRRANLRGANLDGANLRNANLEGATLRDVQLSARTNLRGAFLGRERLGAWVRDDDRRAIPASEAKPRPKSQTGHTQ